MDFQTTYAEFTKIKLSILRLQTLLSGRIHEGPLRHPASEAVKKYVSEYCVFGPSMETDKNYLYDDYFATCECDKEFPVSRAMFLEGLAEVVPGLTCRSEKWEFDGRSGEDHNLEGIGLACLATGVHDGDQFDFDKQIESLVKTPLPW